MSKNKLELGFFAIAQNAHFDEFGELTMEKVVSGLSMKEFPSVVPLFLCFSLVGSSLAPSGEYIYSFAIARDGDEKPLHTGFSKWIKPEDDLSNPVLPVAQKLMISFSGQFFEPGLYTITLVIEDSSKSHSFYVIDGS